LIYPHFQYEEFRMPQHQPARANRLSVCMIVRNEEAVLARCLASVKPAADEIVVVDTGSTDRTAAIAREHGAMVVHTEWKNDFSDARNISIKHATGDWILWLDADDVVPAESIEALRRLTRESPDRVFAFVVRNERPGGTGSAFVQARMFPRRDDVFFERRIHEQITLSALRAGLLLEQQAVVIEHHGYGDAEAVRKKAERNITMLLDEYDRDDPDPVMAIEIADAYRIYGKPGEARAWYQNVLDLGSIEIIMPSIASQAHLGLGTGDTEAGDYAAAERHFRAALALEPDRTDVLYGLAVALDLAGRDAEAIDVLGEILDMKEKPLDVSVDFREARIKTYMRLERLLRENGRGAETPALSQRGLAELPQRPEIHALAGRSFLLSGKLIEALRAFEESIRITGPGNIEAYIGLCMAYIRADRAETAAQTMVSVKPLFENHPRYWAFVRGFLSEAGIGQSPANVDEKEIEEQAKYLRVIYALPAAGAR
jgi:Flp pilus assembly protein TadD